MKDISRTNSAVYKIIARVFESYNVSHSLCVYFWQFVWAFTLHIALPVAVCLPVIALLLGESNPDNFYHTALLLLWAIAYLIGCVLWAIAGIFTVLAVIVIPVGYLGETDLASKLVEMKFSNTLIGGYLKGKKEKVCPILTFVD